MREMATQLDTLGQDINVGDLVYYSINSLNNLFVMGKVTGFTKDFVKTEIVWTDAPHWDRSPAVGDERRVSSSCTLNLDNDIRALLKLPKKTA